MLFYIFHSCFAWEDDDVLIVFDYWKDAPDGRLHHMIEQRGTRQLFFVVSHFHEDHYNPDILTVEGARLLLSYDTVKRRRVDKMLPAAILHPREYYEDEYLRLDACLSTDVGMSSVVTLKDGTVLYHAGDNNNWYFDENPGEHIRCSLHEMEGLFLASLRSVKAAAPQGVDYAMFPVDPRLGKETLRGPGQFLHHVPTRHFYPMHCWERYAEVDSILPQLQDTFPNTRIHLAGDF